MSNNSSSSSCDHTQIFIDARYTLNFVVYNIAAPLYFFLVLPGQALLFLAFLVQAKKEHTYMYQVYCAGAETAEVVIRSLYFCSMHIQMGSIGLNWNSSFQDALIKCYACVWYTARLAIPLTTSTSILALLLSVAMAGDRVLALLKPIKYKNMNHRLSQPIVLIACVLVSYAISAFDVWRISYSKTSSGRYFLASDVAYMSLPFVTFLVSLRIGVQTATLIALGLLSAYLLYLYRERFVNNSTNLTTALDRIKHVKESEKTLVFLTILECSFTIAGTCIQMAYYVFAYGFPSTYYCWSNILTPIFDTARMVIEGSNFFIALIIRKKVRDMVKRVLRYCAQWKSSSGGNEVIELK